MLCVTVGGWGWGSDWYCNEQRGRVPAVAPCISWHASLAAQRVQTWEETDNTVVCKVSSVKWLGLVSSLAGLVVLTNFYYKLWVQNFDHKKGSEDLWTTGHSLTESGNALKWSQPFYFLIAVYCQIQSEYWGHSEAGQTRTALCRANTSSSSPLEFNQALSNTK